MTRLRDKAAWKVLLVTMAFALMTAACGGGEESNGGSGDQPLSGEIAVSGSSTVEPISSTIAQLFSQENPDVSISVDGPGTGDGFALFCEGKTDISDASRPIEAEEQKLCKKGGIDYIELKVAIDGISVLTSKDNAEIECLDYKDLYALLGPESEGFESWSDANALGEEIGAGHVPYPDVPLEITAPGEESGTYDSFGELVLESISYDQRGIKEDAPVIRPDYQSSANDNVIIQGVSGNETSLGWVGFAFYTENSDKVRAIPVAEEGDDCIEPTEETIAAGEYPISRALYFYVNSAKAEENAAVTAFVDYYLTEENLSIAVQETGYVEQPADVIQETITVWEDKETGTRDG